MEKKHVLQTLMFVLFLTTLTVHSKVKNETISEKITVKKNTFTSTTDPGWSYTCDDGIEVELLSLGLKNNVPASIDITDVSTINRIVVEIVYKGNNPGSTIEIQDAEGNSYTANRVVPSGGSSNVWYYRTELPATASVNYSITTHASYAQSMLVYAFREKNNGTASSGVFTALSGYNNIETTTIPIQTDSGPRTVTVELPISELTPDGRYIHIEVSAADGSIAELTEVITDSSFPTGKCCIKVFELSMTNVAGNVNEIEIKIDTRGYNNGQNVNGQSWVMGGAVKTNVRCSCVETDTEEPTADNLNDYILIESIEELPDVTFGDNCSNVTVEYNEYDSFQSCEIDFGPMNAESNIWFYDFPFDEFHHWDKGYYLHLADGTAKVYGRVVNNSDPTSGWIVEILFENLLTYNNWVSSGGQTSNDPQKDQRNYAKVDFNRPNKIKGFGSYKTSNLSLANTSNQHYMDIGARDVYGNYGIGLWVSYQGTVNGQVVNGAKQQIEMNASLKKCVWQREASRLLVREWIVTDAAGNTSVFIQRVAIEQY